MVWSEDQILVRMLINFTSKKVKEFEFSFSKNVELTQLEGNWGKLGLYRINLFFPIKNRIPKVMLPYQNSNKHDYTIF